MTYQSLYVLIKLGKYKENCIGFEDNGIYHIYKPDDIQYITDKYFCSIANPKENTKPICETTEDTLDYLLRKNYIKNYDNEIILNHEGIRVRQIIINNLLIFLNKSVLVPIVVSLITTILYHLLSK